MSKTYKFFVFAIFSLIIFFLNKIVSLFNNQFGSKSNPKSYPLLTRSATVLKHKSVSLQNK